LDTLRRRIVKHKYFYLLLAAPLAFYIIFAYIPMYGITLAFKDFNYAKGIMGSPWVGLDNFREIFAYSDFWSAFSNTLILAFMRLVISFPAPIILALLFNEISNRRARSFFQTTFTFPHFLTWVIVAGLFRKLFADAGVWNQFALLLGLEKNSLLTNASTFRLFLIFSDIWKEAGWGTIIYLAAIAGINPEMYEAAEIDGAGRFRQAMIITWPSIKSTAIILLILSMGQIMNSGGSGFDQVFNLYHPGVFDTADILDTYIYRRTFAEGASFGTSTAVGLFKSIISAILVLSVNKVSNMLGEKGLF